MSRDECAAAQTQGTGVGPEPHTLGTAGLTAGAEHVKSAATKPRAEMALRSEIARLRRENARLRSLDCRACSGAGAIEGFLLGTVKTCPACKGRGTRG